MSELELVYKAGPNPPGHNAGDVFLVEPESLTEASLQNQAANLIPFMNQTDIDELRTKLQARDPRVP